MLKSWKNITRKIDITTDPITQEFIDAAHKTWKLLDRIALVFLLISFGGVIYCILTKSLSVILWGGVIFSFLLYFVFSLFGEHLYGSDVYKHLSLKPIDDEDILKAIIDLSKENVAVDNYRVAVAQQGRKLTYIEYTAMCQYREAIERQQAREASIKQYEEVVGVVGSGKPLYQEKD